MYMLAILINFGSLINMMNRNRPIDRKAQQRNDLFHIIHLLELGLVHLPFSQRNNSPFQTVNLITTNKLSYNVQRPEQRSVGYHSPCTKPRNN